jgi:DNA-binding transcriptional regulator YdaS (Cro superfamily)
MKTISVMKAWMSAATSAEQEMLAEKVGTSRGHLYQLAGGFRQTSAEMAGRIEEATIEMHKLSKGRLPKVFRTDTCAACRQCSYAQKALGARAVTSEFPILTEDFEGAAV